MGQSNLTYRLTGSDDGGGLVLRRPPRGHLLASAHDVVREARIMAALGPSPVPVPRIVGVCHDEEVTPVPLVVMENVDGVVLDSPEQAATMTADALHRVGINMVDTLAAIHDVDLDEAGLSDLASHKPYAQRQLKRWTAQLAASKTREFPVLDDLTAKLQANIPERQSISLVHGDFHIRNVIVGGQDGDIRAVLDWELSTLGDPLADMGSMLGYWAAGPRLMGTQSDAFDGLPGIDELQARYLDRTGRSAESLRYWHCLGLWKLAIIAEGVLRRVSDVAENAAEDGVPTNTVVDSIVELAQEVAVEAGW